MRHREMIATIARHLPHRTQRDVEDVIFLLFELWLDELVRGEEVSIPTIGKLSLETQTLHVSGAARQRLIERLGPGTPPITMRLYGRFRPSQLLKDRLELERHR